jgi:outer membrane protein assembly factor BamB
VACSEPRTDSRSDDDASSRISEDAEGDTSNTNDTASLDATSGIDVPEDISELSITLEFDTPSLSGLVAVTPTVSGGGRILGVEFLVDGVRLDTDLIPPYDYMLNSAQFGDGTHTVGVVTGDEYGQSASAEVEILFDNTPPDIDSVSPADNGIVFFEDGPLKMTMAVEDVGPLKKVDFRINGLKVAEFTDPPFEASIPWEDIFVTADTLPKSIFVQYIAEDTLGLQTEVSGNATVYSRNVWTHESLGEIWGSATVLPNGNIVYGNHNARIRALAPDTGEEQWVQDIGGNVTQGPVYDAASDRIFAGGGDGLLYALASNGGGVQWTADFGSPLGGQVRVLGNVVYAPVFGGSIRALNTSNGSQLWQYNFPNQVFASPAVAPDGTVIVGCKDKFIYAIKEGSLLWSVETGGEVLGWPVIGADGTAYIGSNDGRMYALGQDGSTTWDADVQGQLWGAPLIGDDGDLYAISTSKFLTKLDIATGTVLWSTKTEGLTYGGPVQDANGTLYVGTSGGKIFALAPETGAIIWALDVSDSSINGAPVITNDMLIVGSTDRNLYALQLSISDQ